MEALVPFEEEMHKNSQQGYIMGVIYACDLENISSVCGYSLPRDEKVSIE